MRKDQPFRWTQQCQNVYEQFKKEIASDSVLVHFDPKLPIVLTTDASATAVAGILSHEFSVGDKRPIAFISRALNKAERNYCSIQKEALAIFFSVIKLYQYLIGAKFIIETDHKPLLAMFGHDKGLPLMADARMQRWALILSGFDYQIRYVKGELNNADALSRMPQFETSEEGEEVNYVNYVKFDDYLQLNFQNVAKATRQDIVLSKVMSAILDGTIQNLSGDLFKPFRSRYNELSVESGCIVWGYRTVIPSKLQTQVLADLHKSHLGIVKTKGLARSYIWWPSIDAHIEKLIKGCC